MASTTIPISEVQFLTRAADPNARLLAWNGGLYRAVYKQCSERCLEMFRAGLMDRLITRHLMVETELTSLSLEGYGLVLRQRRIPFVTYPHEWTGEMLKDAALLLLEVESELVARDQTLQDAHPWNILFDGPTPLLVDIGSIISQPRKPSLWSAEGEFSRFFVNPLRLMAQGHSNIAHLMLSEDVLGITPEDMDMFLASQAGLVSICSKRLKSGIKSLCPELVRSVIRGTLSSKRPADRVRHAIDREDRLNYVENLKQCVKSIDPPKRRTKWSNYYEGDFPRFDIQDQWSAKHHSIAAALALARPRTVLDIGCNRGWYGQLAGRQGSLVVGCDTDETALGSLYDDAKRDSLRILPLLMDICRPSPPRGLLCCRHFPSATDRLQCEMVIAAALTHHLVFKAGLEVDEIVEALSMFGNRWLCVEFVGKEDSFVKTWWTPRFDWYTLDSFVLALQRRYAKITQFPSHPEHRTLLLCER